MPHPIPPAAPFAHFTYSQRLRHLSVVGWVIDGLGGPAVADHVSRPDDAIRFVVYGDQGRMTLPDGHTDLAAYARDLWAHHHDPDRVLLERVRRDHRGGNLGRRLLDALADAAPHPEAVLPRDHPRWREEATHGVDRLRAARAIEAHVTTAGTIGTGAPLPLLVAQGWAPVWALMLRPTPDRAPAELLWEMRSDPEMAKLVGAAFGTQVATELAVPNRSPTEILAMLDTVDTSLPTALGAEPGGDPSAIRSVAAFVDGMASTIAPALAAHILHDRRLSDDLVRMIGRHEQLQRSVAVALAYDAAAWVITAAPRVSATGSSVWDAHLRQARWREYVRHAARMETDAQWPVDGVPPRSDSLPNPSYAERMAEIDAALTRFDSAMTSSEVAEVIACWYWQAFDSIEGQRRPRTLIPLRLGRAPILEAADARSLVAQHWGDIHREGRLSGSATSRAQVSEKPRDLG